ncbi:L-aspartate oxidase [Bifidobacterium ruminantium]|uniref:L-aspartate oxidase n=1 Tax=Bifidobacterium ruminantium TaxID=78346 RepID=UPI003D9A2839
MGDGAARKSQEVLLVCKDEFVESNTYHAQGGVATAIFDDDSPALHAADTMAAGHGLCDRTAVDILTDEGARRVRELIGDGWHVDRDGEGHVLRGLEAAHCRSRVVHAGGDATGKVLELDVSAMVKANPNITVLEHAFLNDILVHDGHAAGVRLAVRDAQSGVETCIVDADRVVLATGGAGRLYPYTTNPAVATGDGLAAAIRAGAQVADLEFYQFHPTAMAVGEHFLVSEAVRGEGAVLLDEHGHRFMTDIDPKAELAPRDVVARANFRTMQAQGGKPIMLDVSPMAKENPDLADFLRHRFPTIDAYTRALGFDWSKEPIPVAPAAHYWMGGIRTDLFGRASIPGLYAAGECARTGVQGANRLASNSLLEGMVYGYRAGLAAANDADDAAWQPQDFDNSAIKGMPVCQRPMTLHMPTETTQTQVWNRTRIEDAMWKHVGVIRDGDTLLQGVSVLGEALATANHAEAAESVENGTQTADYAHQVAMWENRNLLTVGYVAAVAAGNRCESRGAHTRQDYPTINPTIAHSIAYQMA